MATVDQSRVYALFQSVVELPEAERENALVEALAIEPDVVAEVRKLLVADASLAHMTARPIAADLTNALKSLAPGSMVGTRVGPFELRAELGRGGMGLVYRAERVDGVVEQDVAIKFVRRELLDADTVKRFQLERKLMAALDHPYIARLIDAAELDDGTPYFVMEYVAGEPITDYVARDKPGVRERVELMRKLCSAVAEAHRELIVHRDIKPGNILITANGNPKLLDFGIAKPLVGHSEQTGTAQRYLSPYYAAPEQMAGVPVGVACDVYALGLLMYELLTGRRPFDFTDLSAGQIERLVMDVPPPAPSAMLARDAANGGPIRPRQLAGDLDGIVLRCLRKAPGERYPSVEQLDADLANYLEGRPVAARGGHTAYRVRKFVGRHRFAVAAGVVAFVTLAAGAAALVRQNEILTQERDRAEYAVEFMKDAFTAADPGGAMGADVTARQILESTRPKLEETFETRPDLFASLASTIADVEMAMGMTPQALELAGRANDAARRAGSDPVLRQHLLVTEAKLLNNFGEGAKARERLDEAGTLDTVDRTEWELAYGRTLCRSDRDACLAMIEKATASVRDRPPTDDLAMAARWTLADMYGARDMQKALDVYTETLSWLRSGLPVNHPRVMRTRLRRVTLLGQGGRHEDALTEIDAVMAGLDEVYGAQSTIPLVARTNRGVTLLELGRHAEAAADFRITVTEWERMAGAEHPKTLNAKVNLADALMEMPQQHHDEAEALVRFTFAAGFKRYGARHEQALYLRLVLTDVLQARGRHAEALALLTEPAALEGLGIAKYYREAYFDELKRAHDGTCGTPQAPADACRIATETLKKAS